MQFSELSLHKTLLKALEEANHNTTTPVQEKAIPSILTGNDTIVKAQTGTGKTAAFALPILQQLLKEQNVAKGQKQIKALILSPTRELAVQINDSFKTYAKYTNLRSTAVYGGMSIKPQQEVLQKGVDILVATPGRLIDLYFQDSVTLTHLKTLVLDEADLMLDMGFIGDIKKIASFCPKNRQTLLFSATLPSKITDLASDLLNNPEEIHIKVSKENQGKINQTLYYLPKKNKIDLCLYVLRNTVKGKVIIFRRTKFGVDKLEKTLSKNGYKVSSLHGDKTQNLRNQAVENFKNGTTTILIATDVAARGIDIKEVDAVINIDLPNIAETYVHRIGRTARAGKSGIAIAFCSPDENSYIKTIETYLKKKLTIVEEHPFPLVKPKAKKPEKPVSKHKKNRKSASSKKKKKRWY